MEIKISTQQVLKLLYIFSWIIFVGVSIEAGAFIFNTAWWMISKPAAAVFLWEKIDLSALFKYDRGYFFVVTFSMCIAAVLRACIFYAIIRILHDQKLDLSQPFTKGMGRFIFTVAYLALMIGVTSVTAGKYLDWLTTLGVSTPSLQTLRLAGADVWLFMGITLFVIGHIFKRGIEIQAENDLTI